MPLLLLIDDTIAAAVPTTTTTTSTILPLLLPLSPLPLPLQLPLPDIVSTATTSLVYIRASATAIRVVRVFLYKQSHPHFSICSVVFGVDGDVLFVAFVVSHYYFSFAFSLHQYMILLPLPPFVLFFHPVKFNYCCCFCCSMISPRGRPWDGILLLPSTFFPPPPLFDLFLCSDYYYYYYYSVSDVLLLFPLLVVAGHLLRCLPIAVALRYHPAALYGSGLLHLSHCYRYSSCS